MLVMIIIILFKDGICDENSSVFNDDNDNDENERRKTNQKKKNISILVELRAKMKKSQVQN